MLSYSCILNKKWTRPLTADTPVFAIHQISLTLNTQGPKQRVATLCQKGFWCPNGGFLSIWNPILFDMETSQGFLKKNQRLKPHTTHLSALISQTWSMKHDWLVCLSVMAYWAVVMVLRPSSVSLQVWLYETRFETTRTLRNDCCFFSFILDKTNLLNKMKIHVW